LSSPAKERFRPGDAIAWRNCPRIDDTRVEHPAFAIAMSVVHDTPSELALVRRPGYPMKRRRAEVETPPGFRHPVVRRWLEGWSDETWRAPWRVLVLKRPDAHHAISLFSDDATGAVGFWYIDLIGPLRRTAAGYDFPEHGLDLVVQPDLESWEWKDADELEFNVQEGRYTRAEADGLYREGERALEHLRRSRSDFERWLTWRPDPHWCISSMPAGWDEL